MKLLIFYCHDLDEIVLRFFQNHTERMIVKDCGGFMQSGRYYELIGEFE